MDERRSLFQISPKVGRALSNSVTDSSGMI
jgi:hypothetical protein